MYLITGGGSGIGRSLARALADRGHKVLIVGRRETLLKETAAHSPLIQSLCADVSTAEGLQAIENQLDSVSQIHGLINNAGTLSPVVPLNEITREAWHHAFQTNVDAALFLPQRFQAQLQQGRVLNIGSGAAYFPIQAWAAYCTTKAALAMLTRCWQLESAQVFFASVMPGIIDTHMQEMARSEHAMAAEQTQFYQKLKEQNRLITPETVAEFLCWLLLDVDNETYVSKEWDIYDSSHHIKWLKPPHQVLHWDI
ncbi:MAG: SDR family NAD(P)-dependent oxidoreductase [Legionella sp.]|nr:MAG: SDR family NAD(P)-dependent oxidoreductase [Legionella sp.]